MSKPVPGLHLAHMSICPCARPYERGPVYLNFLVNRDEQALDQQVEAFTLSLETVLQDLGKLPETTFHVVGVDSDDTRFVLEVVIDGSKAQNSRAIVDTVPAEEQEKEEVAHALALLRPHSDGSDVAGPVRSPVLHSPPGAGEGV